MKNNRLMAISFGVEMLARVSGFPVETAFNIAKLNALVRRALEPFEQTRIQIIGAHTDPKTGQPKDKEAQAALQKEFNDLMNQEIDFTVPDDRRLSWTALSAISSPISPSRLDGMYREGVVKDAPDLSSYKTYTLSGFDLPKLIDMSGALFSLGAPETYPLNSSFIPVLLENMKRVAPVAESVFNGGEIPESITVLAISEDDLKNNKIEVNGDILMKLMPFITGELK